MEQVIKELPTSELGRLAEDLTVLRAENNALRKRLADAEKERNANAGKARYVRRLWMAERERADKLEKYKSDCKMLRVGLVFVGLIAAIYFMTVVTGGWLLPR